ncbi:hypothetical protein [Arcobacter sp. F2176]|uniref:hypothetical protein n=1 Tax=Arcobacter sp. F2176 TaxID=2044511 RepID=UPI00100AAF8E|nr:hypothetical protein [Arcobacter sp. F2176]RXJ82161.1 hypothetical protein CRU95_04550 [Arcobacter sp. F2176]
MNSEEEVNESFMIMLFMNLPFFIIAFDAILREKEEVYFMIVSIVFSIVFFSMALEIVFDFKAIILGNMFGMATTLFPSLIISNFIKEYNFSEYLYIIPPLLYLIIYIFLRNKEIENNKYKKLDKDRELLQIIKDMNLKCPISNINYKRIINTRDYNKSMGKEKLEQRERDLKKKKEREKIDMIKNKICKGALND